MLNKRENEVMNAVYSLCREEGVCLLSPTELINALPARRKYSETQLEKILQALALDDYFQLLSSSRGGEKVYVISLHASGYAYKRYDEQRRRGAAAKVGWAVCSAIIAFVVGWALKWIFS
jgi:hypothetical protein